MNITLGADPEVFIKKDNRIISAHGLVEGTKKKPQEIYKGAVQIDGVALEYNIKPAKNKAEFAAYNMVVLRQVKEIVQAKNLGLSIAIVPTAHFTQEYFDKEIPDENKILGCDPDFNAYTGQVNEPPTTPKPMRTGAGHLHIGWEEPSPVDSQEHLMDCIAITKQLDHSIGFLSHLWDRDKERQELYGKMGSFRPKTYGVEYRVLSNRWLAYPNLWPWLYETAHKAINDLLDGKCYWKNKELPWNLVGFPDKFPNMINNKVAYNQIRKNMNKFLELNYHNHLTSKALEI